MKKLYSLLILVFVSASLFSQTFYHYTATKSGAWYDMSVWSIGVRTDGVQKTLVTIPSAFTVSVDNNVNNMGMGDVNLNLHGHLNILPNTSLNFTAASSIEIFGTGTILGTTNNQRIVLGGVVKYDGSLDNTKSGASIATAATGIAPNGFWTLAMLPVRFVSFSAVKTNSNVQLKWSTASETGNEYFEIQRSNDGSSWKTIGKLNGAGSTASITSYSFSDPEATAAVVYYRLKQVDKNGVTEYSIVKTVRGDKIASAKIYGGNQTVNIEMNTEVKTPVTVSIMNTNGQVIERKQYQSGYKISINISSKKNEIVLVNINDNNGLNQTAKVYL